MFIRHENLIQKKIDMPSRPALILLTLICAACTSIGPETVPQDQFNYNAAIATASEEQLLYNLVRLRYSESPSFLRVSSVISQYNRAVTANATAGVNTSMSGEDSASAGGQVVWADKPTITYVPISGQEFSQNLLTPLPPGELIELMLAGWPPDLVVRTSMLSFNGVDNDFAHPSVRRQADPDFAEIFTLWKRLSEVDAVGLRKETTSSRKTQFFMYFKPSDDPGVQADLNRFQRILELDPEIEEFRLNYGQFPREPDEIAIFSGSIWAIMTNLAWQFEVPEGHVRDGRTGVRFVSAQLSNIAPIRIRFSATPPETAFVRVFAHGYWFYLDDTDSQSKRAFSFLELLLNMARSNSAPTGPVVTISN